MIVYDPSDNRVCAQKPPAILRNGERSVHGMRR
jgi:hypothetical protein